MTKKKNTKIEAYLEKRKISLLRLAAETEIAFSTIKHITSGNGNPSKKKIDKILEYLECKYEDIF